MKQQFSFALVLVAAGALASAFAAEVTADFTKPVAKFRPALHSSGYAALYERAYGARWDDSIREMNFDYVRTHDLALINPGSRTFDTHFIFPLMHLDATKAENYYFAATDFMLDLQEKLGLKVFFRLGTSIEHTGLNHFNAEIPSDFDKMAEAFAGTVRHFTKGWGGGRPRDIAYWEIWNEPDGLNNMWSFNGGFDDRAKENRNAERRDLFVKFFVTVLKRLKSEFPELKIGGPALCSMREDWFRPILRACKAGGLRPDFLSWHCYGNDPDRMFKMVEAADRMALEEGFPGLEMIINEWHFVPKSGWNSCARVRGPGTFNDIDSACYTLTILSRLQTSRYDQAYFYGCRHTGNWGFRDYNTGDLNKNFFALKAFGSIKRDCTDIFASGSGDRSVTVFAAAGTDGRNRRLLVTDYCGRDQRIDVAVKGLEGVSKANVQVLSYERDLEPQTVTVREGRFSLTKPDAYSAAFLVSFETDAK